MRPFVRVKLRAHGSETGFDVAQALAIRQLRERHRQVLIPTGEAARVRVASIAGNALLKLFVGKMLDQLCKDGAALIHAPLFRGSKNCRGYEKRLIDFKSFPKPAPPSC